MLGDIYYFNMENSFELIKLNNKAFHLHYFYLLQIVKNLEDLFYFDYILMSSKSIFYSFSFNKVLNINKVFST